LQKFIYEEEKGLKFLKAVIRSLFVFQPESEIKLVFNFFSPKNLLIF